MEGDAGERRRQGRRGEGGGGVAARRWEERGGGAARVWGRVCLPPYGRPAHMGQGPGPGCREKTENPPSFLVLMIF